MIIDVSHIAVELLVDAKLPSELAQMVIAQQRHIEELNELNDDLKDSNVRLSEQLEAIRKVTDLISEM